MQAMDGFASHGSQKKKTPNHSTLILQDRLETRAKTFKCLTGEKYFLFLPTHPHSPPPLYTVSSPPQPPSLLSQRETTQQMFSPFTLFPSPKLPSLPSSPTRYSTASYPNTRTKRNKKKRDLCVCVCVCVCFSTFPTQYFCLFPDLLTPSLFLFLYVRRCL